MAEVVVENGLYRMQGLQDEPSIDGVGGNEQELGLKGKQLRVTWIWTIS
jgi:hypothetical protein